MSRGPKEVTLTPEEMLRLCYPNGVQGAEESGLKPWDIAFLRVSLSLPPLLNVGAHAYRSFAAAST